MYYSTIDPHIIGDSSDWVIEKVTPAQLQKLQQAGVVIESYKAACTPEARGSQLDSLIRAVAGGTSALTYLKNHELTVVNEGFYGTDQEVDLSRFEELAYGDRVVLICPFGHVLRIDKTARAGTWLSWSSSQAIAHEGYYGPHNKVFRGEQLKDYSNKVLKGYTPKLVDTDEYIVSGTHIVDAALNKRVVDILDIDTGATFRMSLRGAKPAPKPAGEKKPTGEKKAAKAPSKSTVKKAPAKPKAKATKSEK